MLGGGGREEWRGNSKQKDERNKRYNEERERKGGEREEKISERSRVGFATDFATGGPTLFVHIATSNH